jgi:hypothetical protein
MSNLISMDEHISKARQRVGTLRDRRYAIRFPFAADAELIELSTGTRIEGVTSDLSPGGCFICTSRPLELHSRARLTLQYKSESFESFVLIRVTKPRIGMGVEFIDTDTPSDKLLSRWIDHLRRSR